MIFPHNVGLGATRNPKLVEEIARITAKELRATGVQWTFAPSVAVPRDERWGRTYEGFAGTGRPDDRTPGRRFPLDQGDTHLDEATLKKIHMQGYITAIRAGVGSIMPSYNSWNGEKCSGSKRLLTEILKGELGFEGFLISDYNALDDLPGDFRADIKQSINAGMDMVMVPQKYREFFTTLKGLVEQGEVPLSRIDDAVTRILRTKFALGLFEEGRSPLADRSLQKSFGSPEHRDVARRAVRESLVLLKNDQRALPLSKSAKRIHVAGKSADDLGNQLGGWTITWQGKSGAPTTGTTILAALKSAAKAERKSPIPGTAPARPEPMSAWSWWARRPTPNSSETGTI